MSTEPTSLPRFTPGQRVRAQGHEGVVMAEPAPPEGHVRVRMPEFEGVFELGQVEAVPTLDQVAAETARETSEPIGG